MSKVNIIDTIGINKIRLALFLVLALVHGILIFFVVFNLGAIMYPQENAVNIMKLVDIQEDLPLMPVLLPPSPSPHPLPVEPPPVISQNAVEAAAETMVVADKVPEDQVVVGSLPVVQYPDVPRQRVQSEKMVYMNQSQISEPPKFSDKDILRNVAYPPIAQRSGIEGMVILDLFIDSQGVIRWIKIFKEDPEGRGFGEAAVNAFKGIKAVPAKANSISVAVRYRYPIRFTIK